MNFGDFFASLGGIWTRLWNNFIFNFTNAYKVEGCHELEENIMGLTIGYVTLSYIGFKIKYINESAFKAIKISNPEITSLSQLIGKDFLELYSSNIYEKNEVIDSIKDCINSGNPSYTHKQKIIEEGKEKYTKTIFQPVLGKNNKVKKLNVIGIDITDEEIANKEMSKSFKAQEEIFVSISHELKTPINLIFSAAQLLNIHIKSEDLEDKGHKIEKSSKIITQNCYRTIKLINNILDVSKIEGGFYELSLKNKNIVNVIDNIVESVSYYIKDKELSIIFDPKMEEKIIALDLYKFERIMLNLISNAIKFSKAKGIILIDIIDKGKFVEISVEDKGIGIDKKNIDGIFDKFKQENKSSNFKAGGTGIGLHLVKSIVDLYGGSISVESTINKGSKFIVSLPSITVDGSTYTQEDCNNEDRVEMIKFELSDIYT